MQIAFHGAAQTVTGSQHLISVNGAKILLDCGLYQGRRKEAYERNQTFKFDVRKLDAVLLSHAHIDHSGNLPNLIKQGYTGPIYATHITTHLTDVMLRDSGHIQESDADFVNKIRARRNQRPIEPLYTIRDAVRVNECFRPQGFYKSFEVVPGVQAQFVPAGHIFGSAAIVLDIEERGDHFRLWFSGDIGRCSLPIIPDPALPEAADYLIMECTYGHKAHRDIAQAVEEFRRVVKKTLERGGKVVVPSFAAGRTQELVYYLHEMIDDGEIPTVPVYVDSPLAVNVTDIFRAHPEYFDEEAQAFMAEDRHRNALEFPSLHYTRSVAESKAINDYSGPAIIISASGMAETGRILHHLRNNITDRKNTILIVSWQAPYTLGRRLADQEVRVKIFGEVYTRRAEVVTIGGFSAHAGRDMLLQYAQASRSQLKQIFLVHGEPDSAAALQETLREEKIAPIFYPGMHSCVEI
ncbi:MAG: MBL fold metallo-hydrolase [Anaerolineales bacterium]